MACRHLDLFAILSFSLNIKTCCLYVIWKKQDQIWAKILCIPKNMHYRTPMCGSIAADSLMLFSHSINARGLPLSACHCLAALPAKSAFNSATKRLLLLHEVNLWRFVVILLLHNKDQQ